MSYRILFINWPGTKYHGEILSTRISLPADDLPERLQILEWHHPVDPAFCIVAKGNLAWQVIRRPVGRPRPKPKEMIAEAYAKSSAETRDRNPGGPEGRISFHPEQRDISVVLLTYNRPEMLKRCLRALAAQTRLPDEVIVVMNSCGQETANLLAGYRGPFKRFETLVANEGTNICKPRMAGFARSRGARVLFHDDDNWLAPDALRKMELALNCGRNIGFAYPGLIDVYEDGRQIPRPYWKGGEFNLPSLTVGNWIDVCALVRREAFEEVDGFELHGPRFEDWRLWLRIAQRGWRGKKADTELYYYNHEGMKSRHYEISVEEGFLAVHRETLRTAIFTPWAGRGICFDKTFQSIASLMMRHPRLVWYVMDNSCSKKFQKRLRDAITQSDLWPRVRWMEEEHRPIMPIPPAGSDDVGQQCARIWNRALTEITEELVLSIEHDMCVPPDLLDRLYPGLFPSYTIAGAIYRRGHFLVLRLHGTDVLSGEHLDEPSGRLERDVGYDRWFDVDVLGFGAALLRRNRIADEGIVFGRINNAAGVWPAADTCLAAQLKERGMKTRGILLHDRPLHYHGGQWT